MRPWIGLAIVIATVASCRAVSVGEVDTTSTCPVTDALAPFAFRVSVRDSSTSEWLSAMVRVNDGAFSATLIPGPSARGGNPDGYYGVQDRPGTYTVTVTSAGYREWQRTGVVVKRGTGCHVEPVALPALLQP